MTDPSTPDTSAPRLDCDLSAATTSLTYNTIQRWAVTPTTPDSIIVPGSDGQPLVTIHPDGRLEYGPAYTPDTAALAFWEALEKLARAHRYGAPLNASINAHLKAGQEAERKVNRLDKMAAAWLDRFPATIQTATAVDAIHQVTRGNSARVNALAAVDQTVDRMNQAAADEPQRPETINPITRGDA